MRRRPFVSSISRSSAFAVREFLDAMSTRPNTLLHQIVSHMIALKSLLEPHRMVLNKPKNEEALILMSAGIMESRQVYVYIYAADLHDHHAEMTPKPALSSA